MGKLTDIAYYEWAYEFFNRELFDGNLPTVRITLMPNADYAGQFVPAFRILNLNPKLFPHFQHREILATLVHEMCHCWQQRCGHPNPDNDHDEEWAGKMLELGLRGDHWAARAIVPDGRYDVAFQKLTVRAAEWESEWREQQRRRKQEERLQRQVQRRREVRRQVERKWRY